MGRGLDGFMLTRKGKCPRKGVEMPAVALCSFEGPWKGVVFHLFPVALARGKHLFPFRTEQLSPSAPMVLGPQGPGRVGRRRFIRQTSRPRAARLSFRRTAKVAAVPAPAEADPSPPAELR